VLIPPAPGVTSALGLLLADLRYDFTATYLGSLSNPDVAALQRVYATLERQALAQMALDGVAAQDVVLVRSAEVRYARQGFEMEVEVPHDFDALTLAKVCQAFHALHQQSYSYAMRTEEVTLVNAVVRAVAGLPKPSLGRIRVASARRDPRPRRVYVDGHWHAATVVDRATLVVGDIVEGPAIVEQSDSTSVLLPGDVARVDPLHNLVVSVAGA
jgi:N-methylhydantoinase A